MEFLQKPDYPGNVRELKNLLERIYLLCDNDVVEPMDIENMMFTSSKKSCKEDLDFWNSTEAFADKKKEFETRYLSTQLRLNANNVSKTADALGMQQSNLSRKLHDLGIL